jgi:hypothetical protein
MRCKGVSKDDLSTRLALLVFAQQPGLLRTIALALAVLAFAVVDGS